MLNKARLRRTGLFLLAGGFLLGCSNTLQEKTTEESPRPPVEYRITEGACGRIVFQERLADNFDDALGILEQRKAQEFNNCPDAPCAEIDSELLNLEVVDDDENVPNADFTAIQFNDRSTGLSIHSLHEVLDSDGYLYFIAWCPD